MGAATPALSATVIRQGVIFVPAVLIMKALIGVDGLIWAQPITDVLSLAVIIIMLRRKIRKTDFNNQPQRNKKRKASQSSRPEARIR